MLWRPGAGTPPRPRVDGPVVDVDGAFKTYPGSATAALEDVSLRVEGGEFVYLVGASGSGKSTLLKVLYAAERADAGAVDVAGFNLRELTSRTVPDFRRRIGVVFQDFQLLPHKTIADNVAFALQVVGRRHLAAQRVPQALGMVGLEAKAHRLPGELSGGEQQRVAVARAIVNKPVLLVADEPTGNLDPDTSEQILRVLDQVCRLGTTVVMATHDQALVDTHRHRVVELSGGKVVRDAGAGGYSGPRDTGATAVRDGGGAA